MELLTTFMPGYDAAAGLATTYGASGSSAAIGWDGADVSA